MGKALIYFVLAFAHLAGEKQMHAICAAAYLMLVAAEIAAIAFARQ